MGNIARSFILAFAVLIAVSSSASGAVKDFVPRIFNYTGELELDVKHETNENKAETTGTESSSTVLTERLRLTAGGFIYHPRFILLSLMASGGLRHDKFESDFRDTGWSASTAQEYDLRAFALPEHPYNLELFFSRRTPFVSGRFLDVSQPVITEKGAIFRYKKWPASLNARYILNTVESGGVTTDTESYGLAGSYSIWNFINSLAYSHSTATSPGTRNSSDNYFFTNEFRYRRIGLSSTFDYSTSNQGGREISLDTKRLSWTELLDIKLPWNFTWNASYGHSEEQFETEGTRTSIITNSPSMQISHKLYESLMTSYNLSHSSNKSSQGDFQTTAHAVSMNYVKKIPRGRVLATASARRSVTDRKGTPSVLNELHSARVFDEITLTGRDVDEGSIVVRVRNPDSGALIELQKDVHYIVAAIRDSTRLTIASVPPEILREPDFLYEFLVSFSTISGNVEFENRGRGFNVRLELFDALVTPYYSYSRNEETVLSGSLPGGPDTTTSTAYGVIFYKQPFMLLVEYQEISSRLNPSNAYRADMTYNASITPTTSINARASYLKSTFPQGIAGIQQGAEERQGFSESAYSAGLRLVKTFPRKNLSLSLGGSYALRSGLTKTTSYSLDSSLVWKIGNLDVSAGARMSHTMSDLSIGKQEINQQFYYLNVKRKLF